MHTIYDNPPPPILYSMATHNLSNICNPHHCANSLQLIRPLACSYLCSRVAADVWGSIALSSAWRIWRRTKKINQGPTISDSQDREVEREGETTGRNKDQQDLIITKIHSTQKTG
jgi:hypothetical protein